MAGICEEFGYWRSFGFYFVVFFATLIAYVIIFVIVYLINLMLGDLYKSFSITTLLAISGGIFFISLFGIAPFISTVQRWLICKVYK